MTPLEKFREQVQIAKDSSTYVVMTADESEALLADIENEIEAGIDRGIEMARPTGE